MGEPSQDQQVERDALGPLVPPYTGGNTDYLQFRKHLGATIAEMSKFIGLKGGQSEGFLWICGKLMALKFSENTLKRLQGETPPTAKKQKCTVAKPNLNPERFDLNAEQVASLLSTEDGLFKEVNQKYDELKIAVNKALDEIEKKHPKLQAPAMEALSNRAALYARQEAVNVVVPDDAGGGEQANNEQLEKIQQDMMELRDNLDMAKARVDVKQGVIDLLDADIKEKENQLRELSPVNNGDKVKLAKREMLIETVKEFRDKKNRIADELKDAEEEVKKLEAKAKMLEEQLEDQLRGGNQSLWNVFMSLFKNKK